MRELWSQLAAMEDRITAKLNTHLADHEKQRARTLAAIRWGVTTIMGLVSTLVVLWEVFVRGEGL